MKIEKGHLYQIINDARIDSSMHEKIFLIVKMPRFLLPKESTLFNTASVFIDEKIVDWPLNFIKKFSRKLT